MDLKTDEILYLSGDGLSLREPGIDLPLSPKPNPHVFLLFVVGKL